jgi:hypothetical protein
MRLAMLTLIVAGSSAFAQRPAPNPTGWGSVLYPGTGGPPARGINGGFGSVLYPGTGGPPGSGHVGALGSRPISRPFVPPPAHDPVHGGTVIVPYPVYYGGGYYGYDPSAGYTQSSAPGYSADPGNYASPSQAPIVIINEGYRPETANPVMRDYSNAPLPEPGPGYAPARSDPQATIYLIALIDHNILPAIAYWVEGDTLNYITQEGMQNRLSLALVDREFSKRLNDDRGVEFKLPAVK